MKKYFLLCFLTITFFAATMAQSVVYNPGNIVSGNLPADGFAKIDLLIFNNTGDSLDIGWSMIYNDMPNGWDYSLCDFGTCYPGIPSNGKMKRMGVSDTAFLKINLSAMNIAGSGTVVFVVEPKIGEKDTITFNISATPLSLKDNYFNNSLSLFPNPASDFLIADFKSAQNASLIISDIMGTVIKQDKLIAGKNIFSVQDLAEGVYFCSFLTDGYTETKKIIVSR